VKNKPLDDYLRAVRPPIKPQKQPAPNGATDGDCPIIEAGSHRRGVDYRGLRRDLVLGLMIVSTPDVASLKTNEKKGNPQAALITNLTVVTGRLPLQIECRSTPVERGSPTPDRRVFAASGPGGPRSRSKDVGFNRLNGFRRRALGVPVDDGQQRLLVCGHVGPGWPTAEIPAGGQLIS
jgi:hypothetical protein